FDELFGPDMAPWPPSDPAWLPTAAIAPDGTIPAAVARFIDHQQRAPVQPMTQDSPNATLLARLLSLKLAISSYWDAQQALDSLAGRYPAQASEPRTLADHQVVLAAWQAGYADLASAAERIQAARSQIADRL